MKRRVIVTACYLALLIVYTYTLRSRAVGPPVDVDLSSIPLRIGGYAGTTQAIDERVVDLLGADQSLFREYVGPSGRPIWVFLGYFAVPREHSQIHSPKHCYPGSGWSIAGERRTGVVVDNQRINANCLDITDGARHQTVFYWFDTDAGIVTNEFSLKWVQMKNTLLGKSRRSTFVRFSTPMEDNDGDAARAELRAFIGQFAPHLRAALDEGNAGT